MKTKTPLTLWEKGAGPVLIGAALMAGTATSIAIIVAHWRPYWERISTSLACVTLTFVIAIAVVGIAHLKERGLPDG